MDWASFKVDYFVKLMALTFSTHEHEAAAATHMAGRMLHEAGGTVGDIADLLKRRREETAMMPRERAPAGITKNGSSTFQVDLKSWPNGAAIR